MSFTTDIKKEIVSKSAALSRGGLAAKKASVSAFVRTSGALGVKDGAPTFFLVSETETVAEFFMQLFSEVFSVELFVTHATRDRKSGRDKLVMQCPPAEATATLDRLGLLKRDKSGIREGIAASLIKSEEQKLAYIQGAFLGGGSCILPKASGGSGYHLEIVFDDRQTAKDFCELLVEMELIAKLVERKETQVVYIKSKEVISDFLSVIGAENCLRKFEAFTQKRDAANQDNRARNCFSGNADKTAIAAVKQVVAIQKIQEKTHFADLSEELIALCKARLKYPEKSLRELAELLGTSKSCLNHRIRRLMDIAEEL
ncbi:MAG: DNA-binding protein WhiA [Clostridia bacterium]|nr:DNA-binding protein WhiA [Clostridia bacterium]